MLDGTLLLPIQRQNQTAGEGQRLLHSNEDIALAQRLLADSRALVQQAGEMAMGFFHKAQPTSARVWSKAGGSPVTEADIVVDTFLKVSLSNLMPDAAWLSEETTDNPARLNSHAVWVVDPIDGTRAFLEGHADWAVSVALLIAGAPVLGLLYAPAHAIFFTATIGRGALRNGQPITVSAQSDWHGARISGPRDALLTLAQKQPGIVIAKRVPSLALRLARVAEGSIDAALVSTDARDWDIAAVDLILTEAGGAVTTLAGKKPAYNLHQPRHGALLASGPGLQSGLLDHAVAISANGGLERRQHGMAKLD
jgi:myo-inositol-1(or 4)-monophosphatase